MDKFNLLLRYMSWVKRHYISKHIEVPHIQKKCFNIFNKRLNYTNFKVLNLLLTNIQQKYFGENFQIYILIKMQFLKELSKFSFIKKIKMYKSFNLKKFYSHFQKFKKKSIILLYY